MGTRTGYAPGTFCWANHSTPDLNAAKSYYGGLFGWGYDDRTGDGFWMARKGDQNVAALYPLDDQEHAQGIPPHWNNYVSVVDADAAAARATELGGTVVEGPYDVSDAGRTAVLNDPEGAMFWVWQPRAHIGAGRVNESGCLTWNELRTAEPERVLLFYADLFGWSFEQVDRTAGGGYWEISTPAAGGRRNGGVRQLPSADALSSATYSWIPYYAVESVLATTEAARAAGGRVHAGQGRPDADATATIEDPTGAVVGLYQGPLDA
ncbi:VOC family protein [Pseudactinotalea sp.]|uniref:VOC family protein n=1 Tax=Pseudactinotalea sp. TaxID=1926260 RepID=UPI003B3A8D97